MKTYKGIGKVPEVFHLGHEEEAEKLPKGRADDEAANAAAASARRSFAEFLKTKLDDVGNLKNDMAILIAGALMRARPSETQLAAILDRIGLEDEGVPIRCVEIHSGIPHADIPPGEMIFARNPEQFQVVLCARIVAVFG